MSTPTRSLPRLLLSVLLACAAFSAQAQVFIPDGTLSLTGSVTVVETDQRLAFNANPDGGTPQTAGRTNVALATNGGSAFESSRISTTYGDDKLNNGTYGAGFPDINDNTRPWISLATDSNGWGGVKFASAITLDRFGFGSRFDNRSDGDFTMQYTTDSFAGVDLETPVQVDALTWTTIGTLTSTTATEFGRHLFELDTPVANVTGVRVVASQGGSAITEIEAYELSSALTVTTLADNGAGSLRDAISSIAAGGTVTFDPSLSGMNITLGGTELLIDKDLTIDASALPAGITIDANNASRVINITSGSVVTLDSLTITGGNAIGLSGGGGIYADESSLTVRNSTIAGNSANVRGGGLFSDTNLSGLTTTLINCTITNNSAGTAGGGIHNNEGKTILTHCTITGNTAPAGFGSGVSSYGDSLTETEVFATIISGNTNSDVDFVSALTDSFTSTDANLVGTGNATGNFSQPKDQVGITNPQLAPLGDYGGPTQTMPPLSASSPAVNAAITLAGSPATDQRGLPRIYASFPDIGAAELQYSIPIVTTTADSGAGSLRDNITNASPGDNLTFDPSLSGMTITLGSTELLIDKDLTIDASALPDGITIDANNASRVILITSGSVVTLDSLTITGGNAVGLSGGGIRVVESSLTIQNSTIAGNSADERGGGLFSNTTLAGLTTTLINCTVTNNTAGTAGGGIHNDDGKTILTHCTVTGNTAPAGFGSGVSSYGDTFTETEVFATIVSGNTNSDVDFVFDATNSFSSTDANLIGTGNATGNFSQPNDQVGITDPQLAPLGDYGGPTRTMPPLSVLSPAVNAAITIVGSPATDQRGLPRIYGSLPDTGAAELSEGIVVTLADSGAGSLRNVIANATPGDTIPFDPSLSGMTITLAGTELVIDKDLIIDASALPGGITISGGNASRLIKVTSGKVVTLENFILRDGNALGGDLFQGAGGGAICNEGILTLLDCLLTNNQAEDTGPGLNGGDGGAILNTSSGDLTLRDCLLTSNRAGDGLDGGDGGAIHNAGTLLMERTTLSQNSSGPGTTGDLDEAYSAGSGGGLYNRGTATLVDSTIADNTAEDGEFSVGLFDGGDGGSGGGIYGSGNGNLSLTRCTVANNQAGDAGGSASGIGGDGGSGGGLYILNGTCTLTNCTVTGNGDGTAASSPGGSGQDGRGGAIWNGGETTLVHTTVTLNTSTSEGGGVHAGLTGDTLAIENSIIAANTAPAGPDLFRDGTSPPTINVTGNNLIGDNSTVAATFPVSSLVGTGATPLAPLLSPLGDYGGFTETMPPLPGSPAINAGGTTDPGGTDQRGLPRFVNGALDIGAVEDQSAPDLAALWPTDNDFDGIPYGVEFALGTNPNAPDPGNPANLTSPAINGSGHATFTFGRNPAAEANTIWILKRSTTLLPGSFVEIFRFDGPTLAPTNQAGITSIPSPTSFSVTDTTPPAGKAFYLFEAIYVP